MSNIDKQALVIPQREKHDWSQAVMRDCDFCQQWALTVRHSDGGCICASCCDSEYTTALSSALVVALDELEAKDKRIAELDSDNAYIKNRHKELDLLIGKNILVMQAAIIEWQGTGDARKGLAWIYNTLFGPGELPDESEKDAQAYFDRKYAPLDEELMNLHRWFWEQSEAERAAAAGKGEAS